LLPWFPGGRSRPLSGDSGFTSVGASVELSSIKLLACTVGAHDRQERRSRQVTEPVNRHVLQAQDELWREMLELASTVESMLDQAVLVLCENRTELAAVVKTQERTVNAREVRIRERCIRALALYQPVATDLRRLVSVLRLAETLERVGDMAAKIARRTRRAAEDPMAPPIPSSVAILAVAVSHAFKEVIAELRRDDAAGARSALPDERAIDRQYRAVRRELKDAIRRRPERVRPMLRLMNSARNLERVSDHILDIANAIIFIKEGFG
jgi:phosphate transport system protein